MEVKSCRTNEIKLMKNPINRMYQRLQEIYIYIYTHTHTYIYMQIDLIENQNNWVHFFLMLVNIIIT